MPRLGGGGSMSTTFNPLPADIIIVVVVFASIVYFITEVCDQMRPDKERLQAVFILVGLFILLILMGGLIGKDLALM